jgi:hypothetical protein
VAISPDNPDVVVVLDVGGTDGLIYAAASKDGGMNFYDMGAIGGTSTAGNTINVAYDLDVSPISSGNIYYVAIAGAHAAPALGGSAITATVTTAFTDSDGLAEIYDITYVDQDGVAANAGTITFTANSTVGATGVVALALGDTGVQDITAVALNAQNDETTGAFNITTRGALSLGTVATPFAFTDGAAIGSTGAIYYYNLGSVVGSWHDAVDDFGSGDVVPAGTNPVGGWPFIATDFRAVEFSTQFGSDFSVMAISETVGAAAGAGAMRLHLFSLASHKWDADLNLTAYPVTVDDGADAAATFAVNKAAIGMGPDFMGLEEETLICWVAASITIDLGLGTQDEDGGLYRIDDTATVTPVKAGTGMNSVEYDGTTVVAGAYADNNVYRVTEPDVSSPVARSARSLKRIGIDDTAANDMVIVHFAGENVFGAKSGIGSALSKSTDYGYIWNDFCFIDQGAAAYDDLYMLADGSAWYVSMNDGVTADIYRMSGGVTQRVLCIDMAVTAVNFMLRGIPGDKDVIYAADKSGATLDIYVSADGGVSRWSRKTTFPGVAINDMAVESATIVYIADGVMVFKSTNSGSLWGEGVDTGLAPGLFNLISLGDGKLIASSVIGGINFSTDGGATWTITMGVSALELAPTYVAATGLGPTDTIFAASAASINVYNGPPAFLAEFKSMNVPAIVGATGTEVNTGIVYDQGILYVLETDPVGAAATYLVHSLVPTAYPHSGVLWGTRSPAGAYVMNTAPGSALHHVNTTNSVKLYGINTGGPGVAYFEDIVSLPSAAPVLRTPADGDLFEIVAPMLADAELVSFTWDRAHAKITSYQLWIALDEDFTELVPLWNNVAAAWQAPIPVLSPSNIVAIIANRGAFDPGKTYYWKVNVLTPFNGVFSETRSFTIAPSAASVPTLGAPANGAMDVGTNPAFSWSPVTGCTMYEFQLSEGTAFAVTLVSEQVPNTAIQITTALEEGKTYFWRVRAVSPVQGEWSSIGNFVVAVPEEPEAPPVTITQQAPPQITITTPAPAPPVTLAPPVEEKIAPAYIWAIIIIGAVLVIAVIVLIVRTRRSV